MMCFRWIIHNEGKHINPSLRLLNDALHRVRGQVRLENTPFGSRLVVELDDTVAPSGRPRIEVNEDLTIGQVLYARFMNVPMTEIAHTLGVSVRTLHRRWKAVTEAHLPP